MHPQYEMFDARSVPFIGDYNWIQLVKLADGTLFGFMMWTDNRDVVPGGRPARDDPRRVRRPDVPGCQPRQHVPKRRRVRTAHPRELGHDPVDAPPGGWAPRSSKPVWGRKLPGGFDSRPPPRGEIGE